MDNEIHFKMYFICSVYFANSGEPPALTSKTSEFPEEKSKTTADSLLVATPDQEGSCRDSSMDSKPKKGLIFEICSDDGFQIRCESIEGIRSPDLLVLFPCSVVMTLDGRKWR